MSGRDVAKGLALAAKEARRRAEQQRDGAIKYGHRHDVITLLVVAEAFDELATWCDEQAADQGDPMENSGAAKVIPIRGSVAQQNTQPFPSEQASRKRLVKSRK